MTTIWAILFVITLDGPVAINAMQVPSMEQCREVAAMTSAIFPNRFVLCIEESST